MIVNDIKIPHLQKWQNLTFEDVFDIEFQKSARLLLDISFGISLFLYIFGTFIILTKSTPSMGLFKYSLMCQLTLNFGAGFYLFFLNPIYMFKISCNVYFTHFDKFIKNEWIWFCNAIQYIIVPGTFLAFILALIIRVQAIFAFSSSTLLNSYKIFVFYGFLVVFAGLTIAIPSYYTEGNLHENQQIIISNIPGMKELFERIPLSSSVTLKEDSVAYLMVLFSAMVVWCFTSVVAVTGLHILFLWKLNKIKNIVSKETFNLQKMLYKALVIQMLNSTIFGALPVIVYLLANILHDLLDKRTGNFISLFASQHLTVDVICLIYFVKPYRIYVKSIFWKQKLNTVVTPSNTSTFVSSPVQVK